MTVKRKALVPAQAGVEAVARITEDPMVAYTDGKIFNQMLKGAKMLASSDLTPDAYKGKPENCFSAMVISARMGLSPFETMQHLYIIHGKASWSSTFLIARMNSLKRYTSLDWEWKGKQGQEEWGCRMYGFVRGMVTTDGVPVVHRGPSVTVAMAKDMGWWAKKGSAWPKLTQLMLQYRSAAFFARTFCPEATLGFQTREEVMDVGEPVHVHDQADADDMTDSLKAAATTIEGEVVNGGNSNQSDDEENPLDDEEETTEAK